jgi:hypothetical protein
MGVLFEFAYVNYAAKRDYAEQAKQRRGDDVERVGDIHLAM